MEEPWPKPPKQGGAQHDAGQHFSDHGRLADSMDQAPAHSSGEDNQDQLNEKTGERILNIFPQIAEQRSGWIEA